MRKNLCIVLILLICFTTTFTYIVKGTEDDGKYDKEKYYIVNLTYIYWK